MRLLLENLANNSIWVAIGILASVVGFILTIFLLLVTSNLKKKLLQYSDIKKFNEIRVKLIRELNAYKDLISKNNVLDEKLISDVTTAIRTFEDYKSLRSFSDKIYIRIILAHLNKEKSKINKQILCNQIAYFISRCKKEREEII